MIPKIIHYCWFGEKPLPELAVKCIASWKRLCPDYEIVRWDEGNFDLNCCPYVQEAHETGRYAFVSDYARLYILLSQGGIYMDTDVELIRKPDKFLTHSAFSGFQDERRVQTGVMAAERKLPLFQYLLDYYNDRHFADETGKQDDVTNVSIITEMLTAKGLTPNGRYQLVDGLALYPRDFFCPKDLETGRITITENTHAIHYFDASWMTPRQRFHTKLAQILGPKTTKNLKRILRRTKGK